MSNITGAYEGAIENSNTNKYRFKKLLGEGTFGQVWLAKDKNNNKVAIKAYKFNEQSIHDMLREQDCLRRIRNRCNEYAVCQLDQYNHNGKERLVIDFIEGNTMAKLMESYMPESRISRWRFKALNDLSYGLYIFHQMGVAHQDLKEVNIMHDKVLDRFKIIDWGLCCGDEMLFRRNCGSVGTEYTTSPELFNKYNIISEQYADLNWQRYKTPLRTDQQAWKVAYNNKVLEITKIQSWEEQKAHDIWSLGIVLLRFLTISAKSDLDKDGKLQKYFTYPEYFKLNNNDINQLINKAVYKGVPKDIANVIKSFLDFNIENRIKNFEDYAKQFLPPEKVEDIELVRTKIPEKVEERILLQKPENIDYVEEIVIEQSIETRAREACKTIDLNVNRVYVFEDNGKDYCILLKDIACDNQYSFNRNTKTFINPFTNNSIQLNESTFNEILNITCEKLKPETPPIQRTISQPNIAMSIPQSIQNLEIPPPPKPILQSVSAPNLVLPKQYSKMNIDSDSIIPPIPPIPVSAMEIDTPNFFPMSIDYATFTDSNNFNDSILIPLLNSDSMSSFDITSLRKTHPDLNEKLKNSRYQKIINDKIEKEKKELKKLLRKMFIDPNINFNDINSVSLDGLYLDKIPEVLRHLHNLETLNLTDNNITKLENLNFPKLKVLDITMNPVAKNDEEIDIYRTSHPNVNIITKLSDIVIETESEFEDENLFNDDNIEIIDY